MTPEVTTLLPATGPEVPGMPGMRVSVCEDAAAKGFYSELEPEKSLKNSKGDLKGVNQQDHLVTICCFFLIYPLVNDVTMERFTIFNWETHDQ